MKIYFVYPNKTDSELFLKSGVRNFLISYYYDKDGNKIELLKKTYPDSNIMLDSGAYSAHSLNDEILIDEYLEFLKINKTNVEYVINLDSIGSAEESLKNYKEITNKGFTVMPVYHFGEDYSFLDYYIKNSEYIGIGGATGFKWSQRQLFNTIGRILERFPKGKQIHMLGTTNFQLLYKYSTQITSCDSSIISRGARFNETLSMSGIPVRVSGNSSGSRATKDNINALQRHMVSRILQIEKEINERAYKINND